MAADATALDHVTPYDRAAWSDTQIEEWLANGTRRRELSDYPGFRVEVERDDVLDTLVVRIYDTNRRQFYSIWSWTYFADWLWDIVSTMSRGAGH